MVVVPGGYCRHPGVGVTGVWCGGHRGSLELPLRQGFRMRKKGSRQHLIAFTAAFMAAKLMAVLVIWAVRSPRHSTIQSVDLKSYE